MILTDHKIKDYGQKLVAPFAGDRVQAVGYDLTAKKKLHCPPILRRPFNCETAAFARA